MNDSRSHTLGGARKVAGSRCIYRVGEVRRAFCIVYSGVGGNIYHQVRSVSADRCVDLSAVSYIAVSMTQADKVETRGCRPEKLDAELSRCARDKRAHYSLRI
jgi:hypothetical protein